MIEVVRSGCTQPDLIKFNLDKQKSSILPPGFKYAQFHQAMGGAAAGLARCTPDRGADRFEKAVTYRFLETVCPPQQIVHEEHNDSATETGISLSTDLLPECSTQIGSKSLVYPLIMFTPASAYSHIYTRAHHIVGAPVIPKTVSILEYGTLVHITLCLYNYHKIKSRLIFIFDNERGMCAGGSVGNLHLHGVLCVLLF